MARRFTYVLIWLALTAEVTGWVFEGKWHTPLTTLGDFLFTGLPGVHVMPWDIMVVGTLLSVRKNLRKQRLAQFMSSIRITFLGLLGIWCWGLLRGGSMYQTIWQLHPFVMGLLLSLLIVCVCRTKAHVEALGKVVVFAALYRACILITFYLVVARHLPEELPALTDHCDSVLFVSGWFVVIINALERRTLKSLLWVFFSAVLIVTAIVLNNRRIAWLGVGIGLVMSYVLLPKSKLKRTLTRVQLALSPFIVAYLAAGWGHPTGIFKPVGSISTMFGANQDTSSIMRDIENYNLMRTLRVNPFLGVGWGHEYIEEIRAYDISGGFEQYRYLPHNSLLGVIAFSGMFGFAAIWQVVPVAAFLHAKVLRGARLATCRIAAQASLLSFMIIMVQMWGDVGFNHPMVNTMLAVGIGVSARLPYIAGLITKRSRVPAPAKPEPEAQPPPSRGTM